MKKALSLLAAIFLVLVLIPQGIALAGVKEGTYDPSLLVNWTDAAFEEAFGVSSSSFKPAEPQPLTYVASCEHVIDPLTGRESQGGWRYDNRIEPASAEEVLEKVANLSDFSLTLTDDPNRAQYHAIITYKYVRDGNFNYTSMNARIPMYKGVLKVRLVDMTTGKSAEASRDCYCFPESSIEVRILKAGIGGHFFGGPDCLDSEEISAFNDLLGLGIDALYDYRDDEDGVCITKYLGGEVKTLELPQTIHGKPVTGLGDWSLAGEFFSRVNLPGTLTHIGESAFDGCYYLTQIDLPDSVTSIGKNAFCHSGLRSIELSDNVTQLGDGVFSACGDLKRVRLPAELTKIPYSLMWGAAIQHVEIPETVTEIGAMAFASCDRLESIYLPEAVRVVGERAFDGCKAMTKVTCAGQIERVERSGFIDCSRLSTVEFRGGVKHLGEYALASCPRLKTLDLTGLESLGEAAFRWDERLKSVILPQTLTEIGSLPFGDRHGNESYCVPAGLVLTVEEDSYAQAWAQQEELNYVIAAPRAEEERSAQQEANPASALAADKALTQKYPALRRGAKGEAVRRLQKRLIEMGFLDGSADGSFGPMTEEAVSFAQRGMGLEATGIATAQFQARIYGDQ